MKPGPLQRQFATMTLAECLDFCRRNGLTHVEIGTGNWSAAPHLDLDAMIASGDRRAELWRDAASQNLRLSALNCSGNPLHPIGKQHRETTTKTIELAAMLGLDRIVTMSGCPAGPGDSHPNWITTSWPPETTADFEWQCRCCCRTGAETVAFARDDGVRLCFEMHGVQCVDNVEGLPEAARGLLDETVGLNFDPSHLIWMGADPAAVAHRLAGSIIMSMPRTRELRRRRPSTAGSMRSA